jgi:serine protease Do
MFAFPASKRTFVLLLSIALLVTVVVAQAGEEKGYLGVKLQELTPSMAKALQMDDDSGVMINEIVDDGPAEKAGLEDGDVILEFDGKTISDNDDLVKAVRRTSPGDNVEVVVLRNGKNKTLKVEIGKHEDKSFTWVSNDDMHDSHFETYGDGEHKVIIMSGDDDNFVWSSGGDVSFGFDNDRGYMGVNLDDMNEQMGEYFGVEDGKGALVTEVVEDSPADKAGLKAGDVIVRLGEKEIDSSSALHKAVSDTEPEQQMAVKVMRKGKSKDLSITLGEVPEGSYSKRIEFIGGDDHHFAAPRMMKHFGHGGDVDVRVIRRGAPHGAVEIHEMEEIHEAHVEVKEMREELDKMQNELKEMQEELKKK